MQALSQTLEKENFPEEESESLSDRDAEPLVSAEGLKFIVLTLDDDSKEDILPCIPEFNHDEIEGQQNMYIGCCGELGDKLNRLERHIQAFEKNCQI